MLNQLCIALRHAYLRPRVEQPRKYRNVAGTFEGSVGVSLRARKAFDLPKLFLRLRTKSQTPDFPMTLAKWFFGNLLVDDKGLEFYHRH